MKTITIPNYLSRNGKQVSFSEFKEDKVDTILGAILLIIFIGLCGLLAVAL